MATVKWPRQHWVRKAILHLDWEKYVIPGYSLLATVLLAILGFRSEPVPTQTSGIAPSGTNSVAGSPAQNAASLQKKTLLWYYLLAAGGCVVVGVTFFTTSYRAYLRRMYDPTLALHFEREFFYEMNEQRGAAAAVLLLQAQYGDWEKVPRASDIEPVFDFFDNLGFYLYGSQVSDRVLHQSFCHWILLYYQSGRSYIRQRQEGPEGEKSTWEYVEYLVKEVLDIEAAKQGCAANSLRLGPEKYKKYLLEEFDEAEDQFKEDFRKAHPEVFTPPHEKQQEGVALEK